MTEPTVPSVWKETITKYMKEVFKDIEAAIDEENISGVMGIISDMFIDGTANYLLQYPKQVEVQLELDRVLASTRKEIWETYSDEAAKLRRAEFKVFRPEKSDKEI